MSSPTSVDFHFTSISAFKKSRENLKLESCGQQWVEVGKAAKVKVKRNWEGLDDDEGLQGGWGNGPSSSGCNKGRSATVWTLSCSEDRPSFAEFKILNMRGRSVFQIGMTRLHKDERSQFWGDVEEGKAWYLFIDKYGFVDLRDGAKSVRSRSEQSSNALKEPNTMIQGSSFRVEFNPSSRRLSFYRNGGRIGAVQVPFESRGDAGMGGGPFAFAAQMLGRGDALELVDCDGLVETTPD